MSAPVRSPKRDISNGTQKFGMSLASPLINSNVQTPTQLRSPLLPSFSSEKNDEHTQSAIQRLSELLKHPDDLNVKIDFLKKKLLQEKSTVETQLRTDVQSQFDDIQETFRILNSSQSQLQGIRSRLSKIDVLCQDNHTKIPGYETIKEVEPI